MERNIWRMVGLILVLGCMISCQASSSLSVTSTPSSSMPIETSADLPEITPSFPTVEPTGIFSQPTITNVVTPDNSQPGLLISGRVTLEGSIPMEGVEIHCAYASYPGVVVAVTDSSGYYVTEFLPISGDEMVRVWVAKEGYYFKPSGIDPVWESGVYYWRHYYGFENRVLDFVGVQEWEVPPK